MDEAPDLQLDVFRLIADRNFRHSGQVDEGQAQDRGGKVLERDRLRADALVAAGHPVGFAVDLLTDLVRVDVNLVLCVQERGPLLQVQGA